MTTLFSHFTLYKPYLLLMYDLHQPFQFIKETSKTCLQKDMKASKIWNPKMTKQDVVKQVVHYNRPTNIQGTLWWHKTQLQNLLCMVEQFGMPHFFITLTTNEMSSLHWEQIIDIEKIVKHLRTSLD